MFRSVATQALDWLHVLRGFDRSSHHGETRPSRRNCRAHRGRDSWNATRRCVQDELHALKYNVSDTSKGSDYLRARSQPALERCGALPTEEKHAFLKQLQNNRQFRWITSLEDAHESPNQV